MPFDAVIVLVIEHCQAGFVMPFLKAFHGKTNIIFHLSQFSGLQTFIIVWLRLFQSRQKEELIAEILYIAVFFCNEIIFSTGISILTDYDHCIKDDQ